MSDSDPQPVSKHDVLIAGDGLPGSTLALQPRDAMPGLDVLGARHDIGTVVRRIDLQPDGRRVEVEKDGVRETLVADWPIDASGRAGPPKHKLDLAEDNGHDANAVWFRPSEQDASSLLFGMAA